MSIEWERIYDRFIFRLAQSENGIDVTTLMHDFKQSPAVVARFVRAAEKKGFLKLHETQITISETGKTHVAEFVRQSRSGIEKLWRDVPEKFRGRKVSAFAPFLPKKSEVDRAILNIKLDT